jgi:hypothetical protein
MKNQFIFSYAPPSSGVRQGDLLSPLLISLAEDVLSRSISKALLDGETFVL